MQYTAAKNNKQKLKYKDKIKKVYIYEYGKNTKYTRINKLSFIH